MKRFLKALILICALLALCTIASLYIYNNPSLKRTVKDIAHVVIDPFTKSGATKVDEILGESTENMQLKYITNESKDIFIIVFSNNTNLYISYNPTPVKTVRETSHEEKYIASINGGFFTENKNYAGLLIANGVKITDLAPLDNQVTGIAIIDILNNSIVFESASNFEAENFIGNSNFTVFQTGPIIIKQNQLDNIDIEKSTNGKGKYLRSFLGVTSDNKKFIGISTVSYDLKTLANEILTLEEFKDKSINVINLDGGSSVFIYSSENKDYNIGTFKTLPIILGIK